MGLKRILDIPPRPGLGGVVFLEQTAGRRTVFAWASTTVLRRFYVSFPRLLFCIHYLPEGGRYTAMCLRLFYTPDVALRKNSLLYGSFLPNQDLAGYVCMGNRVYAGPTVAELSEACVSAFWSSAFGASLTFEVFPDELPVTGHKPMPLWRVMGREVAEHLEGSYAET